MPTWKKVVVSGSAISQLSNDLNYLAQSQTDAILSGSFSGSFVGDGSGLTNIVADGTISGSAQVTVQDTTGFSDLQSNISASFAVSSSAHTQREAVVTVLSGSAATQREAQKTEIDSRLGAIETFTGSLDNDFVSESELAAATSSLSSSAHTQRVALSASSATYTDSKVGDLSGSSATALRAEYIAADTALSSSQKTYIDAKVAGLVDSAPGTLDTLNELAAALNDDPNFSASIATTIGTKLATDTFNTYSGSAATALRAEYVAGDNSLSSSAAAALRTEYVAGDSALSASAHTQREALYQINSASIAALDGDFATDSELTDLSASVDTHLDANISALSASVDTHLDANISSLSSSAHTARVDLSGSQKTYIDAKVSGLVDSAPATLDTLNELAAALNDDPNFSASIATSIGNRVLTSTFNTYSGSAAAALRTEYTAADTTLSSSADTQRKAISASLATSIAGVQAGALVSGSYSVELKSDTGSLNFTDGLQIGDIYSQGNGTTDIYVPSGAAWVELNYGGQDYIYLDGRKAGVQIENDGTTLEWTFYGQGANAGVFNAPGDIIIPSNKEFNGGKVVVSTITGSANFNTLANLPTLVSGSSQVTISDTDGYSTYSSSVSTYTDAKVSALSASVDAHLDANITALSSSVDAHLDANITALSSSAHSSREALSGSHKTYIDAKVAGLVDSAPGTLDTLNELAAALNDDPNFSASIATSIGNRVLTSTFNTYSGSVATALRAEYVAADTTLSGSAAQAVQDLSGSAHTARVNLATSLYISGSTGNDEVNLKTDSLSFAGEGGISVDVTDNTITINSTDIISSSAQVVDSLNNQTVDFGTGEVTASFFKGDGSGLENITVDQNATVTSNFTSVTSHTVTHNFGTKNVIAFVYDSNDNQILPEELTTTNNNTVDVTFSTSTSGRVVVARGGHIVSGSIPFANLIALPTLVSGSSQVTVQDTDGFTELQSNISASFAVSSSAHTQREALVSALSASVDTHLDANISALSASVDTHLDANITALSSSVDAHLDANITALSSSAHTARGTLASSLTLSGSSGNDIVNLKTEALSIIGTASEIETTVTNNQVAVGIVTNPTLTGNVVVTGNLTVQGDTFENQVTNLNVEDRFILLNSGSNSGDVGIIFGGSDGSANQGSGIFWDSPSNVFGFAQAIGTSDTSATHAAKLGAITTSTSNPSATPTFQGIGSIHVNTNTEEVFIYTS